MGTTEKKSTAASLPHGAVLVKRVQNVISVQSLDGGVIVPPKLEDRGLEALRVDTVLEEGAVRVRVHADRGIVAVGNGRGTVGLAEIRQKTSAVRFSRQVDYGKPAKNQG